VARTVFAVLAVIACTVAFTGCFILIFANSTEIQCVREAGTDPACRITRKFLGSVAISHRDIPGVTDVRMDESCDEDGCSYRAELVTSTGLIVPVNVVYTDRRTVTRQMEEFETFLDGTDKSFEYVQPVPWWVVIMLLGLDLFAVVFVVGFFRRRARIGQS
jgi:hypothetical protein